MFVAFLRRLAIMCFVYPGLIRPLNTIRLRLL